MSEHHASVRWRLTGDSFAYADYNRDHLLVLGAVEVPGSAAPEFLGSPDGVNPEEQFVGSLSSCHMLTFLAISARKRLNVEAYDDDAVGFLEKNPSGKLAITRVVLRPRVVFGEPAPPADVVARMHALAHKECFIASSVLTDIAVEPL